MADVDGLLALIVLPESIEYTITGADRNVLLREVERLAKDEVLVVAVILANHAERVGRVVEEKLGCSIDRQAEEELLQIDSRAIFWDMFEHKLEVALKSLDVGDLIPGEVGSQ